MELINKFIKHMIKSIENMFAPRCKCARNKPKKISDKEWISGYNKWKNQEEVYGQKEQEELKASYKQSLANKKERENK
jgi:hypothetical protein